MAFPDRRTLNVLMTALVFGLVLAIVYVARAVIVIFAFSILFAYLINPIVRFLQSHSLFFENLRGPHVAEAYLALLILLALIIHNLAPQLVPRVAQLVRDSPAMMENVYSGDIAVDMGHRNGWDESQSLRAKAFLQQRRENIRGLVESVRRFVSVAFGGIVLIPILALFFLSDGEKLTDGVIHLVSTRETYEEAKALAADLNNMLRHYIRAKVILAALSLIFCSAAMLCLGYPHALALGLMAGILEFIPVAGWITSLIAIATAGMLTHSHWIWMAALLGLWRMVIDYGIAPRVMGRELEIHPLLAIFTVMIGGAVGGIVGIYLSVPLVAALRVIWQRFAPPAQHVETAPG
ncbi:MAG TPA: AI-2E family transporter [Candidatus Acidoferrales bacterium]|nr:AI-2E family transporter [Candidatus Acidoferrales bacterium]HXE32562.1 AI-2E family transporter [Verrucomicrobiae bacterium]